MDKSINEKRGNFTSEVRFSGNVWTTFIYDQNLHLVDILNPDYENMLLIDDKKKIIGMSLDQLEKMYHGKMRQNLQYVSKKLIQVSRTGIPAYFEYIIEHKNKTNVVVICYAEKRDDGYIYGNTLHLNSNIILKGRKNFTKNLAYDILDNMPALISVRHYNKGNDSEYVFFNKKLKEIFKCEDLLKSPLWNQEEANRFDAETMLSDLPLTKYSISRNDEGKAKLVLELHKYKVNNYLNGDYIFTAAIDITEKYLADKQLQKQYLIMDTIYRGLPFGLIGLDKDGCIVIINTHAMNIFGIKQQSSVVGNCIFDDPILTPEIKESIKTKDETEYLLDYDFEIAKTVFGNFSESGSKKIKNRIIVLKDEDGERIGYLLLCEDKTEEISKKHEFNIIKSRFRGIYDSINSGILIYDSEINVADCNETAMSILGIKNKSDLFNNTNVIKLLNGFGTEMLKKWENSDNNFIKKDIDFAILQKKGYSFSQRNDLASFEGKISYLKGKKDESLGCLIIFNDITEREKKDKKLIENNKKLEEYKRITELESKAADILQWEYDIKTQYIYIISKDPAFPPTGIEISKYLTFIHPNDLPTVISRINELKKGGLADNECQFAYRIKLPIHKEYRNVVLTGVGLRDSEGNICKYTGFRRDMTEWARLNNDLKNKNIELTKAKLLAEESNRLKSAFLANMSHEIRTPLNAIVGFSDVLVNTEDKNQKEEYAKIISKNTILLLSLLDDILDLSKIESGIVEINNNPFNINDCLNNVIDTIQPRYTNYNVKLIKEKPYKDCIVNLDLHRIEQIYINFLTNALKFTETGEIKIGYRKENKGLMIYVSDTGIGIDEKDYSKIFKQFEKINSFKQGTGLGLAICKAITDACHGKIGFNSEITKGSTFWAWFPTEANVTD